MPGDLRYYTNQVEHNSDCHISYCLDFFNLRLRVDDYEGNIDSICRRIAQVAQTHALTKIFIKSREDDWQTFLSKGCMLEGIYKGYFRGSDAYCMALYYDLERRTSDYWMVEDQIMNQVLALPSEARSSRGAGQLYTAHRPDGGCRAARRFIRSHLPNLPDTDE